MRLLLLGAVSTGIVVAMSVALLFPIFTSVFTEGPQPPSHVMMAFSINNEANLPGWCTDLQSVLAKSQVKATVFVTGQVAEKYPQCVAGLSSNKNLDLGSQTYHYAALASIPDYSKALEEVKAGKDAVDRAGNIDSRVFKAPYGKVDENIYSLLNRSGIAADFSYGEHYNKYQNGQFVRYNVTSYDGAAHPAGFFLDNIKQATGTPVVIDFDNSVPSPAVGAFVSDISSGMAKRSDAALVNASDLTHMDLTRSVSLG